MDKADGIVSVTEKLDSIDVKWALIGRANLALQGMDIPVKKIGISTGDFNREKVEAVFKEYPVLKSFVLSNGEGEEISYSVDGTEVQFCFEHEHGFYAKFLESAQFKIMPLLDKSVPCLKLEDEARGYAYLGKHERAKEIEEFLDTR